MQVFKMKNNWWNQPKPWNIHYLIHHTIRSGGTGFSIGVTCPTYTPPAGNNIECNFTVSYTPPTGNNVELDFCTQQ